MAKLSDVFFIGGSPCSGKSTVAEMISEEFRLRYFKVDDFLDSYLERGKAAGKPVCTKLSGMTSEQIWMRTPEEQNAEELQFYREIFEFVLNDLTKLDSTGGVITEGAAYLPELMRQIGIDTKHYVNITPTRHFQVTRYRERPWIASILEGCKDKTAAFENWMCRDALFAVHVKSQAESMGYKTVVVDGAENPETICREVCSAMRLYGE